MRWLLLSVALLQFNDDQFSNCESVNSRSYEPLYLSPLIESGEIEKARQQSLVRGKQFRCGNESYSGFLTVNKQFNSIISYLWNQDPNAPLVLWLMGGPGTTSLQAVFFVNGPFKIEDNLRIKCNNYSWTKAFSMLYIDSPVGTGYSFTDKDDGYARTLSDVTENVYNALKQFFVLFPQYQKSEFYVTGDSYGGKYVPALAYKIHMANESLANLTGIAVGDGYIDPISSLDYSSLLYEVGLIDEIQKEIFKQKEMEIKSLIEAKSQEEAFNKWDVLIAKMLYTGATLYENFTGFTNYYDLRYSTDPYNYSLIELVLNKSENRKALHVGDKSFVFGGDTNVAVVKPMIADIVLSAKDMLAVVMDNYKVLLYSGNMDLILGPAIGNKFLLTLDWKHHDKYLNSTRKILKLKADDKEVSAYVRVVHNFYEVVVRNAGHHVPEDQPEIGFAMITSFINSPFHR